MKRAVFFLIACVWTAASLFAAPSAVIFDFGGVMTGEPDREAVVNFIRQTLQLSQEEFEKANHQKHLVVAQGKSDAEFWLSYAEDKGIKLQPTWSDSLNLVIKDSIGVKPAMYLLVEELKQKGIRVGMLSNIDGRFAKIVRHCGFYDPFDPCLLSCDIDVRKPDKRAYEILLSKLDLPAKEIVFIDDRLENVEMAKKAGLDAILFESEGQLRAELAKRDALRGNGLLSCQSQ